MPHSVNQILRLTKTSADDEVYAAFGIGQSARQFNPIAQLRARIGQTRRNNVRKRAGQYVNFDMYIQYEIGDRFDPTIKEQTALVRTLGQIGSGIVRLKKKCSKDDIPCQNFRTNWANHKATLKRMKKEGRSTKARYELYSPAQLRTILRGPVMRGIFNEMAEMSSNSLKLSFTENSIQRIEKVSASFGDKMGWAPPSDKGPILRIKCRCRIYATGNKRQRERVDTAQNIVQRVADWGWRIQNNTGQRLIEAGLPYRGNIVVNALDA